MPRAIARVILIVNETDVIGRDDAQINAVARRVKAY